MVQPHLCAFAKSDPMGDVFSFLGKTAQGSLRCSARMFHEAFDAAVRAEIHIGRCGNKQKIETLEDLGVMDSWFPVSEKRCYEAPSSKESKKLGTLVVNLHILFNGVPHIPDDFLYGCMAQSVIYFQAGHITSAGKQWMTNCPCLTSVSFEGGLTALATVDDYWLYNCTELTSVRFKGLTALTTVGDHWLYNCNRLTSLTYEGLSGLTRVGVNWLNRCFRLTSVSFEGGLTALTTVGDRWLFACSALSSANFSGLTALSTVGDDWLSRCPSLTSVSIEGLNAELIGTLSENTHLVVNAQEDRLVRV